MARFSIRGLLIAVTFVAVACATLKYASPVLWGILSAAALLMLMGSLVVAFATKGQRRIKAVGFIVCIVTYFVILTYCSQDTVRIMTPTEQVLRAVYGRTSTQRLFDITTGKELSSYRFDVGDGIVQLESSYVPGTVLASPSVTSPTVGLLSVPDLTIFLRIGHLLWAMLFGFLGSMFAGFVYRRNRE